MRASLRILLAALVVTACKCGGTDTTPSATLSKVTVDRATGVAADGKDHATITVTLENSAGAAVAGQTVTLAASGTGNVLSTAAATDATGKTTATLASTDVGTKTITATVGMVVLSQQPTVQFVAGPAAQIVFQVQPANVAAGAMIAPAVQVAIEDAEGHVVTSSTASVTLTLGGGTTGATLQGTATQTASAGVATFSGLSLTLTGSGYTLSAASTGLTAVTSTPFNVTAGAESQLAFTTQPASITAGASFSPSVQVSVEDAYGNVVTTASDMITLSIGSGQMGATLTGMPTAGASSGVATFSGISISLAGSAYTLTASAPSLTSATSTSFSVSAGTASQLAFVVQPSNAQAGVAIAPGVQVAVEDALGNPVLTASNSIALALTSAGGAVLGGTIPQPAAEGFATFSDLTVNLPGTYTLAASSGALAGTSMSFTITTGAPAHVAFVVQPSNVVAGAAIAPAVQVALEDSLGNIIANTTSITLAIGTRATTGAVLAGMVTQPAVAGIASFSNLSIDSVGTGYTLAAVATGYAGATSKTFNVTSSAASSSNTTVSADPTTVTADGVTTTTLTVTVEDAFGNTVANQNVTLQVSGSSNTLTPTGGMTNANGLFTATLASTKAETKTVTVTAGAATATTMVTFTAGLPFAMNTMLAANPTSVTADGTSASTLTLTVLDANNNPVPMQPVTFTVSGTANTLMPTTGMTDMNGLLTATLASTHAETKTITATIGAASAGTITATTSVTFTAGTALAGQSSIAAMPTSLTADGVDTSTITVTIEDSNGNPVPNQAVTFTTTGMGDTLTPAALTTDVNGELTAALVSTVAQTVNVTATVGAFSLPTSVTFVPGKFSASTSMFSASPGTVTADGMSIATLTLIAADAQGNPLVGQSVALTLSGSGNTLMPTAGVLDPTGTFTATLTSTVAEFEIITATLGSGPTLTATVNFIAGAATAGSSSFTATPSSVVADGKTASTLTLVARDQFGNPVVGQGVVLTATGSANAFASSSGPTDSTGTFTTTLTSTKAQAETVTATIGSLGLPAPVTFTAGPASQMTSTLAANPATVTADGLSTSALIVTVVDASGNPVSGQAVSVGVTGSGNVLSASSGTTGVAGTFSTNLSSTKAEAKTVTATVGAFTLTATVTFVTGNASSGNSSIAVSPSSVVADGQSTTTITVTIEDSNGNVVVGEAVNVTASGSQNTLTPASGQTTANGTFTATLASTKAEVKTVTASFGGTQVSIAVKFTAGAPATGDVTISASPSSLTADGMTTSTITVTVEDANGNVVPNQAVSLTATGSGNTLAPSMGTTDVTGVFSATLASTVAQTKTVTAIAGSVTVSTPVAFTAGAASSTLSTISANPTSVTADGMTPSTITVIVLDANGNPVPTQSVLLSVSGTSNTLTPASGSTTSAGTFTSQLTSASAQVKTVTATIGTFQLTTTVAFGAGTPAQGKSTLVATPASLTADGMTPSTLTVTVEDSNGNPVPATNVALTVSGTGNSLMSPGGPTNASGVFTTTLTSTHAEAKTVTATFGAATLTTVVTFVSGGATAGNSSILASPTSLVADGAAKTTLTVTVEDSDSNPIVGQTVQFKVSGTNDTLSASSGTTNASGQVIVTLSSTTAETKTVTATFGGAQVSTTVLFTPGAPSQTQSSFSVTPATVTADGTSAATLSVTVLDAHGNPVPNQMVVYTGSGTGNIFEPTATGTTDATGVFTAAVVSTTAQSETLTATIGSVTLTAPLTFQSGGATSTTSTFKASPASVTADGMSTSTLTLTLLDVQSNPVPGQTVTLTSTGSANTFTPATGVTNASGVFTATISSTKAEIKTITAAVEGLNLTTTVAFTPGGVSGTKSTLIASPTSLTANGTATSTLTVTVEDAQGNPITGQAVSLMATGSGNTLMPGSGSTLAGVFTATLASNHAETKTVTATIGAVMLTTPVAFVAGGASTMTSTLNITPPSVTADGSSTASITLTVEDTNGNPISGQAVTIAASGSKNTLSGTGGNTGTAGTYSVTLASTTAETKTITATFGGLTLTGTVTFTAGAPTSMSSGIAATTPVVADGVSTTAITVTVEDVNGNLVPGAAVTLASTGSGNMLSSMGGNTNASGVFAATMTSTIAETKTITATVGSFQLTTPVVFTAGTASAGTTMFTAGPTPVVADGMTTSTLTVVVKDGNNNLVPNESVVFTVSGSSNILSSPSGSTNSSGVFTSTLASTHAETKTITANIGSGAIMLMQTVTFTAGLASSGTSMIGASPPSLTADGSSKSTITVTVLDSNNNPVNGQAVAISSSGTNNTLAPVSGTGTTNSSGLFTITIASTTAQTKTISATIGTGASAFNLGTTVAFVAGGASSSTTTFVVSPLTSVTADGKSLSTLTVTVDDANSNPISGQSVSLSAPGTGLVFGSNGSSGSTNASGVFQTTLSTTTAQSVTITATIAGSITKTQTVSFIAGAPVSANSKFVASPATNVTANGMAQSTLTVTVEDANGNLVNGQTVSLTSTGTNNTITPASGPTVNGVFTATISSLAAQTDVITAAIGSMPSLTQSVVFTAGSASQTNSIFTAVPSTGLTANGMSASTLTVTINDSNNNPVSGLTVTFSGTGSSNTFTPSAPQTTGTNGQVQVTLTSTFEQTETIKALVGASPTFTLTQSVTFAAGPPASTSTITATPASPNTANGTAATSLVVTVLDANNNPISGQMVSLAASGSGNTFGAISGSTTALGTFTTTLKSTFAQTETITATIVTGVNPTVSVTFVSGAAASATLAITPTSGLIANGTSQATLTATVLDANNNPVSGQTVVFSGGGSSNTFTPSNATATTGTNGQAQVTLTTTVAQTETMKASVAGFSPTQPVTFSPGPPAATSTITAMPSSGIIANGTATTSLVVTVKDANSNIITTGVAVSLGASGTLNTFGATSGTTTSAGTFTTTLASTKEQTETITATIATGVTPQVSVSFISGGAVSANSTISATPSCSVQAQPKTDGGVLATSCVDATATVKAADGGSLSVTGTSTVTVTLADVNNNPVSGTTVTFASSDTSGGTIIATPSGATTAAGTWSSTVTSTTAGLNIITATVSGMTPFTLQIVLYFVPGYALTTGALGSLGTRPPVVTIAATGETLQIVNDGFEYSTLVSGDGGTAAPYKVQACAGGADGGQFCLSGGLVP